MKIFDGKVVVIMLCSTCNIHCKHCYISYQGDFSYNEASDIIKHLREDNFEIMLNGSEPILREEYYPLFKQANCHKILTNGLYLLKHPEKIDKLKENEIEEIALSYHIGIQEQLSIVKDKEIENLIKLLKENGMIVKIMTTITKDNVHNIKEIAKKAYSLGADKIRFTNFINQGNGIYLSNKALSKSDVIEALYSINEVRKEYDKDKFQIQRCGSFGNDIKSNFKCPAGINSIVLAPDYKAYPCVFSTEKGNDIGYYQDGKIYISEDYRNEQNKCKVRMRYNKF